MEGLILIVKGAAVFPDLQRSPVGLKIRREGGCWITAQVFQASVKIV